MPELRLEDAPQKTRDLFNRGFAAMERGNWDYAIDMFIDVLELEPTLLKARKFLRAAEISRSRKGGKKGGPGAIQHAIATATGGPALLKGHLEVKRGKGLAAVLTAENLLRKDPLNLPFLKLLGKAAESAELIEVAVQTLTLARDHYPKDIVVMTWLAKLYMKSGQTKEARALLEDLINLRPNDSTVLKLLKDAMALDSMKKDGWEEAAETGEDFRRMIKDGGEAESLEKEAKAVKSEEDIEALILGTEERIKKEPGNMNFRRELGQLLAQAKRFDEAASALEKAQEVSGARDPEIDRQLSAVRLQKIDDEIATLRASGDEAAAKTREEEREQFLLDDLNARVKRYPNDLDLRYELAVQLRARGQTNEAIQQFQLSRRNPRRRVRSLYYIGLCFKEKEQFDLAIEQLETAASELLAMDGTKKEILYELGDISARTGDTEKAADYFKQIYQVDIGFRDVAEKIETLYKK